MADVQAGEVEVASPTEAAMSGPAGAAVVDALVYGLRVRSAVALPHWPAAPAGDPDLVIETAPWSGPGFEGEPYATRSAVVDGVARLEVRGVAWYEVRDGGRILVAAEPGARAEDVRLYLTGALFGVVLHRRGILPLHASCVELDGSGVAFAGPPGHGKSTLAGALLRRGAGFVSDDICALTPVQSGVVRVWPSAARLKLDPAAIDRIAPSDASDLDPIGANCGKYHVPVAGVRVARAPVPLARLYRLEFGEGEPRIERLSRLDAISTLVDETYMLPYAAMMGLTRQIFRAAAEVSATVRLSRLIRPRGFDHLDAVLDLITHDAGA